jgi:hypothetical protein
LSSIHLTAQVPTPSPLSRKNRLYSPAKLLFSHKFTQIQCEKKFQKLEEQVKTPDF